MKQLLLLLSLSKKSLWNRKATAFLTILSIALSVSLLLSIERIRNSARSSFESTVSDVDLIVGARGGTLNLLLYSVFNIGNATNNISFQTYQEIIKSEDIEWTIPISLGDSHNGFRVVGTTEDYLKFYRYSGKKELALDQGHWSSAVTDLVLGAAVAKQLDYQVGDSLTLSHGSGEVSFQDHDNLAFTVKGILRSTGTPVDKSLYISLEAMTAMHLDWQEGFPVLDEANPKQTSNSDLKNLPPPDLSAVFVKLKSKMDVFNFQRWINTYPLEPLTAILPGVGLSELWQTLGNAESVLILVSLMVFVVSLLAMLIALLSTLNERRREMAILRAIGASREFIFLILIAEGFILAVTGIALGVLCLYLGLFLLRPTLEYQMGLSLNLLSPSRNEYIYASVILVGAVLVSVIPAVKAYTKTLSDGLTVRI